VLTIDGVGEWTTASIGHGDGASLSMLHEMRATGRLLAANLRNVAPEQAKELLKILTEMRGRMMKIIAR
jgi:hypothetical protein